ncbi:WD40 repeat-like protein [Hortaea werneckii]|nr:WD40 repeat-like protein [Hortaea werneckii]
MESGRRGLGVHTQQAPEAILSTAPASPAEEVPPGKPAMAGHEGNTTTSTTTSHPMPPENSTVGSFSFGPAIQRVVTTVTTTTTTALPPIVMHPPKDLQERDPKQYPLAFTPTPNPLKKFAFDYHGRPASFHESEDPNETVRRYQESQAILDNSGGSIKREERHDNYETPQRSTKAPHMHKKVDSIRDGAGLKRTATPPSIAEAAELASLQRKAKKPRSQLQRTQSEAKNITSLNQRTAAGAFPEASNLSPVTPDTESSGVGVLPPRAGARLAEQKRAQSPDKPSRHRLRELQADEDEEDDVDMADNESQDEESQPGPPLYGKRKKTSRQAANGQTAAGASQQGGATATPPVVEEDVDSALRTEPRTRPHLPNIFTSSQQDASLPSPSLSPITAAANAASRNRNTFDDSFGDINEENASVVSGLELDEQSKSHSARSSQSQPSSKAPNMPQFKFTHGAPQQANGGPTILDVPSIVDAFDSMPEAMQTYVMYQFLRRCAKPTLQMVASVVNPALKCDPFNILPPELGLNITRFLDAQSMCRAAQVSKKWRRLINSDETAWKDLLDRDGFVLPDGEIARAVKEGWGWQHAGEKGHEEDLSRYLRKQTPEATHAHGSEVAVQSRAVSDEDEETASSTVASKSKRKLINVAKYGSTKKTKRRVAHPSSSATKPTSAMAPWRRTFAAAQGPLAYATAAAEAVPHAAVGLPSLKNMHLFKSLYQRHYLIRKAWMQEDSQPQHLAFRAHHRHVVTCLLFDSDKILTGSDDTKIHVYDTKTGALRNRLEGHEGGVWALQYDGDTLVSGSTDRSVRVWDLRTGRCLQVFQGHTSTVRCLVILRPVEIGKEADGVTPIMMPKEPLIITGSRDSTLRVWKLPMPGDRPLFQSGPPANDRDNPYFLRTLSGHHNSVRAIAAHGDTLISGSYDCTVRVWKISTGELLHRLQGHTQKVYSVVLDHERGRCISGSMDNLVKVWDLQTGSCLYNLEGHTSLVGLLDLSHDRLVSAAADSTLRIWDPESGACKATLSAHTGAITCFQHDGQKVISGSDRTLKMWNVKNGECVRDLLTDLSGVWQVRFDERRCVAAVQRNNLTYIEVLDFGAPRDGIPSRKCGRRTVVDIHGRETPDVEDAMPVVADEG